MAAASSGVVVVVVEDGDGSGKESHEGKQGVLVGELPDSFSLENGETPQEGTKEHMNVVEVRASFFQDPSHLTGLSLASPGRADILWLHYQRPGAPVEQR